MITGDKVKIKYYIQDMPAISKSDLPGIPNLGCTVTLRPGDVVTISNITGHMLECKTEKGRPAERYCEFYLRDSEVEPITVNKIIVGETEEPKKVLMEIAKEMNRASRKEWKKNLPELMSYLKGWAGGINDVALAMHQVDKENKS